MCTELHCLPSPGGLLDQDCWMVAGMDMVMEAQGIKRKLEQAETSRKASARR